MDWSRYSDANNHSLPRSKRLATYSYPGKAPVGF